MEPVIIEKENSFKISVEKVCDIFQVVVHLFPTENFKKNYKTIINIINNGEMTITKEEYEKYENKPVMHGLLEYKTNTKSFSHLHHTLSYEYEKKMSKETNSKTLNIMALNSLGFKFDKNPDELVIEMDSSISDYIIEMIKNELILKKSFQMFGK